MRYLLAGIFILLAATQGCKKEDKEQRPFMNATIYGVPFSATGDQVQLRTNNSQGHISKYLWASNSSATIMINFDSVRLGASTVTMERAVLQRGGVTSFSASGTLVINALYPYVTGSFEFITHEGVSVKSGQFLVYNK